MNNEEKDNKWYIMYAKSPKAKQDWMDAFKKERGRVEEDRLTGACINLYSHFHESISCTYHVHCIVYLPTYTVIHVHGCP